MSRQNQFGQSANDFAGPHIDDSLRESPIGKGVWRDK